MVNFKIVFAVASAVMTLTTADGSSASNVSQAMSGMSSQDVNTNSYVNQCKPFSLHQLADRFIAMTTPPSTKHHHFATSRVLIVTSLIATKSCPTALRSKVPDHANPGSLVVNSFFNCNIFWCVRKTGDPSIDMFPVQLYESNITLRLRHSVPTMPLFEYKHATRSLVVVVKSLFERKWIEPSAMHTNTLLVLSSSSTFQPKCLGTLESADSLTETLAKYPLVSTPSSLFQWHQPSESVHPETTQLKPNMSATKMYGTNVLSADPPVLGVRG